MNHDEMCEEKWRRMEDAHREDESKRMEKLDLGLRGDRPHPVRIVRKSFTSKRRRHHG